MTLEEVNRKIEQWAGVPAGLLTGETVEENIAQAKALLAYRREQTRKQPQSNAEIFSEWFSQAYGIEVQDDAQKALAQIEKQARLDAGGYPSLQDGGSVNVNLGDTRSTKEQFADWLADQTAFNPFKG